MMNGGASMVDYRVPVEGVDAVVSDYFYLVNPVLVATATRVYVAGM
jgi:hypothetical protein